jgi:hypothetical protein
MSSRTLDLNSDGSHVWTSAGTTEEFVLLPTTGTSTWSWGASPLTWSRLALSTASPMKVHEWRAGSTSSASFGTWWTDETKLDEQEREALIATIVDSIVARAVGADWEHSPEPLESKSAGFIHVPEGVGLSPTFWNGSPAYSSADFAWNDSGSTTWYSSTTEGTFTYASSYTNF